MMKGMWLWGWLLSLAIAAYLGYQIGLSRAEQTPLPENDNFSAQVKAKGISQAGQVAELDREMASVDSSSNTPPIPQRTSSVEEPEGVSDQKNAKGLAATGQVFAQSKAMAREHDLQGREFAEHFTEHDSDWQAKTNISDFLQLHDEAPLIDLQKIICDTRRCQLIGQYGGQHQQWDAILQAMKEQDWWDYSGTSSTSQSDDEQTYFNVYLDKRDTNKD